MVASTRGRRVVCASMWSRADTELVSSSTGTRSKMKYSLLALALAGTIALPEVASCAIQISLFALNHHRVLSPHIVRRSSRDFVAARRTTSTASAGASLASATAKSRRLFRTSTSQDGRLSASRGLRTTLMVVKTPHLGCLLTTYSLCPPASARTPSRARSRTVRLTRMTR